MFYTQLHAITVITKGPVTFGHAKLQAAERADRALFAGEFGLLQLADTDKLISIGIQFY